jgi:hypothetical protein
MGIDRDALVKPLCCVVHSYCYAGCITFARASVRPIVILTALGAHEGNKKCEEATLCV